MKKLSCLLVFCLCVLLALAGCAHTHAYTPSTPTGATCTEASIVRYTCTCGHYYDHEVSPALGHEMTKTEAIAVTCDTAGRPEYYTCSRCEKYYADEAGTTELSSGDLVIPAGHRATHHAAKEPLRFDDGNWEYWECNGCGTLYLDAACTWETTVEEITILSAFNHPDFVVEVEEGRDPIVLQLTDPQLSNTTEMEERAFKYLRETINAIKPDFIIITGDLVYGRNDASGAQLSAFIEFMESFGIPWAPVFGNHDNESEMGVAWQCAQLEAAEHCLFKRGSVTGNGNYTVGIAQGDKLLRVFYMMDSNGCGAPSAASAADVKTGVGFEKDQIDWYTADIAALRELAPDVKISFAFHVQLRVFGEVLDKYDEYAKTWTDDIYKTYEKVWIDKLENADEGDFGIIGAELKNDWGTSAQVFEGLVALGVDSIFVGHEHCNSFSIEYQGVRLQYGQKSSAYDRYNWIKDGVMGSGWDNGTQSWNGPVGSTPLVGGTVIPLSQSGDLLMGYIYLCGEIPPYQNK